MDMAICEKQAKFYGPRWISKQCDYLLASLCIVLSGWLVTDSDMEHAKECIKIDRPHEVM